MTITSASAEQTVAAGAELGRTLEPGSIVALTGELGAGKTCFVQGLAQALGVSGRVTSPTFVLIAEYRGVVPLYHVDAYRTTSLTELIDIGIEECFDAGGVTVVEWGDKLLPLLPARTIHVRIAGVGDELREITISRPGSRESAVSNSRH
jgi:tRNA threonylcarbamoyladenosine biosynthesis protein TsaE